MIVPLDSALNIAFPAITAEFGLALPQLQWLVICYVLTYGSLMLGIGRLGDIYGHAVIFRAGLAWSALAFLLCAWAPGYGWLLGCRVLQGIGAALVISCGAALLTGWFAEAQRPRMLGLYALMFAAGSVLGPALGGWLTARFGWPAVFWFRAPTALASLLLLGRAATMRAAGPREPFDLAGAALLALALGSLLLAINRLGRGDWVGAPLALLGLAATLGFLRQSARSPRPVIALGYFRLPGFAFLNLANGLVHLAGFAVLLFVPFYLTRIAGLPTPQAGLLLAVSAAGSMLAALPAGWLLARVAAPRLAALGIGLTGLGLGLMALWGPASPLALIGAALLLHGAGLGVLQVSYTDSVTATLPRQDRGVAGSLAMLTRTLGVVTVASLLTLIFAALEAAALARGTAPDAAFLAAFHISFALAAAIPAAVLLVGSHRR